MAKRTGKSKAAATKVEGGGRFQPGHTKTGGRQAGTQNKATTEIGQFFRGVLESQTYREGLQRRFDEGKVAPAVKALAYHYGYGKPKEQPTTGALMDEIGRRLDAARDRRVAKQIEEENVIEGEVVATSQLPSGNAT